MNDRKPILEYSNKDKLYQLKKRFNSGSFGYDRAGKDKSKPYFL